LVQASPQENVHLPADFYEQLKGSYSEPFYRQEALGEYLDMYGGNVYSEFGPENVAPVEYDPQLPLCWALDFNVNPLCSLICQITEERTNTLTRAFGSDAVLRVIDEIVLPNSHTVAAAKEFIRRADELDPPYGTKITIYGDASGNQGSTKATRTDYELISEVFQGRTRFRIEMRQNRSNPGVIDRVNTVNNRLKTIAGSRRIFINPRCKELIKDLRQVVWKRDRYGNRVTITHTNGMQDGNITKVTSPNGRLSPYGMVPSMKKFRVAGTVYSGLYEFDAQWAYIPLSVAQRLFTEGSDSASLVEVRLDDIYAVRAVAPHILAALGEGYLTTDWIMQNQSLFSALWLEKIAIGITIGLIVMVAALNIVATLILLVMEKHKDIAILVSMGASRGAITRIFMLQGTVIGALGTLTGAVLGWGLCRVLDHYKLIRVPVDVYQVSYVPFTLLPLDAATVIVGAVLICFLATIHPARGASRLDPAEALRYE